MQNSNFFIAIEASKLMFHEYLYKQFDHLHNTTSTGNWATGNPSQITAVPLRLTGQAPSAPIIVLMDEKLTLMDEEPFSYICKFTFFCLFEKLPWCSKPRKIFIVQHYGTIIPFVLSHS